MDRESAQNISDNDFWQICREMHPNTNYIFPASAAIGVSNDNSFDPEFEFYEQDLMENEEIVSSDDSLQNLYVKQTQAHRKLLSTNENSVNRQKILNTIELLSCSNESEQNRLQNCDNKKCEESDDMESNKNSEQHIKCENNDEIDSINNADDLLLSIADSVHRLKANVNQIDELNEKTGFNAFVVDPNSDLIDFSDDDWMNNESDDVRTSSEKLIKKATHSSIEGNFTFL